MRDTIQKYIEQGMKNRRDRITVFVCLAVIAVCVAFVAFWFLRAPAQTASYCDHEIAHQNGEHDTSCGYVAAKDAYWECGHEHGEGCFTVVSEASPCTHTDEENCAHDDGCGYADEVKNTTACEHTVCNETEGCIYHDTVESHACNFVCTEPDCKKDSAKTGDTTLPAVAWLGTQKTQYEAGQLVQFTLYSSYASPDSTFTQYPARVTFEIPIDNKYFDFAVGSDAVKQGDIYTIEVPQAAGYTGDSMYLYYDSASKLLYYTLEHGQTMNMGLSFGTKNGVTPNGETLTLTPRLSAESSSKIPVADRDFIPASAGLTSVFGWEPVNKTSGANTNGIPNSLGNVLSDGLKDITYTISADNSNGNSSTGVAYTDKLVLTDTLTLNNIYYEIDAKSEVYPGRQWNRFVALIGGQETTLLEVTKGYTDPNSELKFEALFDEEYPETRIVGFVITVTKTRDANSSADIGALDVEVKLHGDNASFDETAVSTEAGKSPYSIKNFADFKAYSHFYDKDVGRTGPGYEAGSDDEVIDRGEGSHSMTKRAYGTKEDALANGAMSLHTYHKAEYDGAVYYTIYYKNNDATLDVLYISDMLQIADEYGNDFYDVMGENGEFDPASIELVDVEIEGAGDEVESGWDIRYTENLKALVGDYGNYPAVLMSKKFTGVTKDTVIKIVYKVNTVSAPEGEADKVATPGTIDRNLSFASSSINPDTNGWSGVLLAEDEVSVQIAGEDTFLELTKTIKDGTAGGSEKVIKKDDTVSFTIKIKNTSDTIPATFTRLVEEWPFDGIFLTEIAVSSSKSGTISSYNLELYETVGEIDTPTNKEKENEATKDIFLKSYTKNQTADVWKTYSTTTKADYFTINGPGNTNVTLAGGETITITLKGTVFANSDAKNRAWIEFPTGSGIGVGPTATVELTSALVKILTNKTAYAVEENEGVLTDTGVAKDFSVNDTVHYVIEVKNDSIADSEEGAIPMGYIHINDTLPRIFRTGGVSLKEVSYSNGGPAVTGTVIVEYPNGALLPLEEVTNTSSSKTPYVPSGITSTDTKEATFKNYSQGYRRYTGSSDNSFYALVNKEYNDAGELVDLALKSGQSLKFHVFLQITDDVYDAYKNSTSSSAFENAVTGAGRQAFKYAGVTSRATVKNTIAKDEDLREASINKSVYAVIKGLKVTESKYGAATAYSSGKFDSIKLLDGAKAEVQEGDHVLYRISLTNDTDAAAAMDSGRIYPTAVSDKLPDGLEFVGFISSSTISTGEKSIGRIFQNSYNREDSYYSCYAAYTKGSTVSTKTMKLTGVSYNETTRTATASMKGDEYIAKGYTMHVYVVAKVNSEAFNGASALTNIGGFEIDKSINMNNGDWQDSVKEGKKLVTNTATISGPKYYANIEKTATKVQIGDTWYNISENTDLAIAPDSLVNWSITYMNSYGSSGSLKKYTITDILPEEFEYVSATITPAWGAQIMLPDPEISKVSDTDPRVKLVWEIDTTVPGYENFAVWPSGFMTLDLVTKWNSEISKTYGSYQNTAALTLDNSYLLEGILDGKGEIRDNDKQTIWADATINMMGTWITSSFKTVENVQPGSPYNYEPSVVAGGGKSVKAIAGDLVEYMLNVRNDSTSLAVENLVIIDVLPHEGDSGVVNLNAERLSKFNVAFTSAPQIVVTIDGVPVDSTLYDVDYTYISGKTTLKKADWSRTEADTLSWQSSSTGSDGNGMNTIRIVFDESVKVPTGETIKVKFVAQTVTSGGNLLPSDQDIAWNSFGYAYTMTGSPTLYAEPLKVGVEVPYSTLDVTKKQVDSDGIEKDGPEVYNFTLEYSESGTDGTWLPAVGIRYSTDGGESFTGVTGPSGGFTVAANATLKLYVPAIGYYRVTEALNPDTDAFKLISICNSWEENVNYLNDSGSYKLGPLQEHVPKGVIFTNELIKDKWNVTLVKKDGNDNALEGVKFTLSSNGQQVGEEFYTSDENGVVDFGKLPEGIYVIEETETLSGFVPLKGPITITVPYSTENDANILPEGVAIAESENGNGDITLTVINYHYELPETGGAGAAPLMASGMLAMLGAGLGILNGKFSRKRRSRT